ncbi:hypothetical protein JCM3765_001417 [Sporobolomyces pararoseus]
MSWSFSLRSPSPTPPPQVTSPSTIEDPNESSSLWGDEGDRNDPIDIGSVWEPQINFKETPFTIAKRNGAKQASFGTSEISTPAQKSKKTTPALPRPVPATSVTQKPAPVFQRPNPKATSPEKPARPTVKVDQTKSDSTSLAPAKAPKARLNKEGWISATDLSKKAPEAVNDVFYQPFNSSEAVEPAPSKIPRAEPSSDVAVSIARPPKALVKKSEHSSETKGRTGAVVKKSSDEQRELDGSENASNRGKLDPNFKSAFRKRRTNETLSTDAITPRPEVPGPISRPSSTIAPSSPPTAFQFYADSQESPETIDSSPPPASPPPTFSRPKVAISQTPSRSVADIPASSSQTPISRQVEIIRPTPVRPLDTSFARIQSSPPYSQAKRINEPVEVVNPPPVPPRSSRYFPSPKRLPSPFLTTTDSSAPQPKQAGPEFSFSQSTRSKLERFRNPQQQLKSFVPPSQQMQPSQSSEFEEFNISEFVAPALELPPQTAPQPPHFGSRSLSAFTPNPHTPPSARRAPFPSTSTTSTSKFSLPLPIAPSVSKKRRMNFLPLEPIESFHRRKGIAPSISGHGYSKPEVEEDDLMYRGGGVLDSPSNRKSFTTQYFSQANGEQDRYAGEIRESSGSRYGGKNLFGSSLEFDDVGERGGGGIKLEKVAFGTSLRSFKPQSTTSSNYLSPSSRVRGGRARRGRGSGRSGLGKSRFGANRIDEMDEEDDEAGEETEQAKLRRLYRSLD